MRWWWAGATAPPGSFTLELALDAPQCVERPSVGSSLATPRSNSHRRPQGGMMAKAARWGGRVLALSPADVARLVGDDNGRKR